MSEDVYAELSQALRESEHELDQANARASEIYLRQRALITQAYRAGMPIGQIAAAVGHHVTATRVMLHEAIATQDTHIWTADEILSGKPKDMPQQPAEHSAKPTVSMRPRRNRTRNS